MPEFQQGDSVRYKPVGGTFKSIIRIPLYSAKSHQAPIPTRPSLWALSVKFARLLAT